MTAMKKDRRLKKGTSKELRGNRNHSKAPRELRKGGLQEKNQALAPLRGRTEGRKLRNREGKTSRLLWSATKTPLSESGDVFQGGGSYGEGYGESLPISRGTKGMEVSGGREKGADGTTGPRPICSKKRGGGVKKSRQGESRKRRTKK